MTLRWAERLSVHSSACLHAECTLAFRIPTPFQLLLSTNSLLLWKHEALLHQDILATHFCHLCVSA